MKKYALILSALFILASCTEVEKNKPAEENTKDINVKAMMKYNFREALDEYQLPKLAFQYDNLEKGDTVTPFPKSISKFIPIGKKVKILDAFWLNKTGDKEIEVWYTQNEEGLWIPFDAEERQKSQLLND